MEQIIVCKILYTKSSSYIPKLQLTDMQTTCSM